MLTSLASVTGVSIPVAGVLITAASIVMGVGAPMVAAFTSQIDRRQLLVAALVLFVIGHLACTLTTDYTWLLVVRCLTVVAAAIVTPQAAATIAVLAPQEKRGAAVSAIFVGWSIASVVAMPAANLLAARVDWRMPFYVCAGLSALVAVWVAYAVPAKVKVTRLSLESWFQVAKHKVLIPVLLVTMVNMAGQFVVFSFMVAALEKGLGFDNAAVAALLLFYGVFGVIGNTLAIRFIARLGADRVVQIALILVAIGIVLWGVAFYVGGRGWLVITLLGLGNIAWGLGGFSANSAQQGRLVAAAPALASASVALNTSSLYLGQAIGTPIGAAIIAVYGYTALPWMAIVFILLAMWLTGRAQRAGQASKASTPAV
jgi:MFS transporter, DHA1 family, inner membrane transport protein